MTWMAWTWQTALFFLFIALLLVSMTIWELKKPGGAGRVGILQIYTTRGDRLFISLLGSAFIHLAWLGFTNFPVFIATVFCLFFAIVVFRFV